MCELLRQGRESEEKSASVMLWIDQVTLRHFTFLFVLLSTEGVCEKIFWVSLDMTYKGNASLVHVNYSCLSQRWPNSFSSFLSLEYCHVFCHVNWSSSRVFGEQQWTLFIEHRAELCLQDDLLQAVWHVSGGARNVQTLTLNTLALCIQPVHSSCFRVG